MVHAIDVQSALSLNLGHQREGGAFEGRNQGWAEHNRSCLS